MDEKICHNCGEVLHEPFFYDLPRYKINGRIVYLCGYCALRRKRKMNKEVNLNIRGNPNFSWIDSFNDLVNKRRHNK